MTLPPKHLECPHCAAPLPVSLEMLQGASAIAPCPACRREVYLIMGKVSNFQPGAEAYDDAP